MEEWRPIQDFPEYEVSNLGRVKGVKKNIILSSQETKGGYLIYRFYQNKKRHQRYLHRILAEAFLPKIEGKNTIDHINQNKKDNRLENLRWADQTEQNLNKPDRTEYRNIYLTYKNTYAVIISRYNKRHSKTFKTLEEAIQYRDMVLNQNKVDESLGNDTREDNQ